VSTAEQAPQIDVPEIEPLPVAVSFASRGLWLTVERVHPRRVVDGTGVAHWTQPVAYEFNDGRLTVYPGQDKIADKFDPQTGGTEEQDVVEYLRGHELYGTDRGFWEVPPAAPDPAPVLAAVLKLAVAAGNPETREAAEGKIADLYEAELSTWKRWQVLDACKATLAAVESAVSLPEPAPADDAPKGATRQSPPAPPKPSPEHLTADHVSSVPRSGGPKPSNLKAGFNPESAPAREQ
jgi:hypothetical protein